MSKYNFDEIDSYTTFTFKGNDYQFWYPNTEQSLKLQKIEDSAKLDAFVISLVRNPEGATYPEFKEVFPQMHVKQKVEFQKMMTKEIGLG